MTATKETDLLKKEQMGVFEQESCRSNGIQVYESFL